MPLEPATTYFDIYRGFDKTKPYPGPLAKAVRKDVPGFLKHHMKNGRFGHNLDAKIHWTHMLLVRLNPLPFEESWRADIRSAYDSQLNAIDHSQADTIIIKNYPNSRW